MIFLKSILVGNVAVLVMWVVIAVVYARRFANSGQSPGLSAVAGGWSHLLHLPLVLILLTVAFGAGLWLVNH